MPRTLGRAWAARILSEGNPSWCSSSGGQADNAASPRVSGRRPVTWRYNGWTEPLW